MVVIVLGLPGSGKTYFATHLAGKWNAEHLNSDRMRKELDKMGDYDPETKKWIYQKMKEEMVRFEKEGKLVVVDATFFKKELRNEFIQAAEKAGGTVKLIRMVADDDVTYERVTKDRPDSEADYEVYLSLKERFDPIEREHLVLDSGRLSLEEMLDKAESMIEKGV